MVLESYYVTFKMVVDKKVVVKSYHVTFKVIAMLRCN